MGSDSLKLTNPFLYVKYFKLKCIYTICINLPICFCNSRVFERFTLFKYCVQKNKYYSFYYNYLNL